MPSGKRKIPVLRYFLIILLFSGMSVSAFYLYLRYKKAQKLRANVENLISARENSALIDSCILNLYGADNNSRLYTITGDKTYLQKFLGDLNKISGVIDKIKFDKNDIADADPQKFKQLMKEKTQATGSYMKLRLLTDSLIRSSTQMNLSLNNMGKQAAKQTVKVQHVVTIDTIKQEKPKKKLLGRIFGAFAAKKAPIVVKDTITTVTTIPGKAVNKRIYNNYYKKLNQVNNKLLANERQMLIINNNLIEEIIASLRLYKAVEALYIRDSKKELQQNLSNIYDEFKQVSVLNFIFLLSLMILVFYNIWKIFRTSRKLLNTAKKLNNMRNRKAGFWPG